MCAPDMCKLTSVCLNKTTYVQMKCKKLSLLFYMRANLQANLKYLNRSLTILHFSTKSLWGTFKTAEPKLHRYFYVTEILKSRAIHPHGCNPISSFDSQWTKHKTKLHSFSFGQSIGFIMIFPDLHPLFASYGK